MHDGHEQFWDFSEILACVSQRVEEFNQGLEIFTVLVSFLSGSLNFFLEFTEWTSIGRLVLF